MKAQSAYKSLVIPASSYIPVNVTGSSFYIENSTGAVDVTFDDGNTVRMKSGQTVDLPPGDYFTKLIFTNPDTANSITVSYYAGTLQIGTRQPGVFTKPAPSYGVFQSYTVLAGADTAVNTTNLRAGKTVADSRQYIIFQWAGTGTDLIAITSAAGGVAQGGLLGASGGGINQIRIDSPMALWLRGLLGASTAVLAMAFYNYDS